jgi:PHP family Zn ribbon phosphoesterase
LADRPLGFKPANAIGYKNLIPLQEIVAEARGVGSGSILVEREYQACLAKFGTEFDILLKASDAELKKGLPPRIAEGVLRVRQGKVSIQAGFDGEYGIISIFGDKDKPPVTEEQLSLF